MSISGVTTISLMQCDKSLLHRVDCGLWKFRPTPLQWLHEVAGYWQELEHAVAHTNPEQHPHQGQDPELEHANCTLSQNLRHLWHCVV